MGFFQYGNDHVSGSWKGPVALGGQAQERWTTKTVVKLRNTRPAIRPALRKSRVYGNVNCKRHRRITKRVLGLVDLSSVFPVLLITRGLYGRFRDGDPKTPRKDEFFGTKICRLDNYIRPAADSCVGLSVE